MSKGLIDLGNWNDTEIGFPVVKPGVIDCTIKFKDISESKSSGKPKAEFGLTPISPVKCTLEETDPASGQTVRKDTEVSGRELLRLTCSLQKQALMTLKQLCIAMGTKWPEKPVDESALRQLFAGFNGKRCRAVVENETYEGRLQAKVKSVLPPQ